MRTKVLPRTLVCTKFPPIKYPIWNGGRHCVGLKLSRISAHNEVTIAYVGKDGNKIYPNVYYFDGTEKDKYQVKNYAWGDALIVPIDELQLLQRVGDREETLEEWLDKPGYAKSKEELDAQG